MTTTNEACGLLRRVKEEDKELVKKLKIIGHGLYDMKTYDPSRLVYQPPVFDPVGKRVRDLLAGNLLEISGEFSPISSSGSYPSTD